ncbi:MAG: YgjV family protein [Firmicutes bacterium]|nr:YgjV family protein [Bacillota bacterium]
MERFLNWLGVDVSPALWITSQAVTLVALAWIFYGFQSKTKGKTLVCTAICNVFLTIAFSLLQNWQAVGIFSFAVMRDLTYFWRERAYPNNKKLSVATLLFFLIGAAIIAAFTIDWQAGTVNLIISLAWQLTAFFLIYGSWAKGCHLIRISRTSFGLLAIVNHVWFANYAAILTETVIIGAIVLFYIKFLNAKRKHSLIKPICVLPTEIKIKKAITCPLTKKVFTPMTCKPK